MRYVRTINFFEREKKKLRPPRATPLGPLGNEHLMSETQNILRDRRTYGAKAF